VDGAGLRVVPRWCGSGPSPGMMCDVEAWIALIVGIVAAAVALAQARQTKRQRVRDFELVFVQRYWQLYDRFAPFVRARQGGPASVEDPTDEQYSAIVAYIDLCEDELAIREAGWVGVRCNLGPVELWACRRSRQGALPFDLARHAGPGAGDVRLPQARRAEASSRNRHRSLSAAATQKVVAWAERKVLKPSTTMRRQGWGRSSGLRVVPTVVGDTRSQAQTAEESEGRVAGRAGVTPSGYRRGHDIT